LSTARFLPSSTLQTTPLTWLIWIGANVVLLIAMLGFVAGD
jgi:hypothetical protein